MKSEGKMTMEKKTIRSGAPYALAGAAVLAVALAIGMGTLVQYALAVCAGCCAFVLGKKLFPDRVVEIERAPQSGNAEVDALIAEARAQLEEIRLANDAIADPALSAQIDAIENTCRKILARLEDQPQMLSSLRTFLRYYLPTTKKLLSARAALEAEVEAGSSAQIAAKISAAMAQVQQAFTKQLAALDEFRFINLESEMDVLRDMMKSDGLVEQEAKETQKNELGGADDPFAGLFAKDGQ